MRLMLSAGFAALSKPRCGSTSLRRALDPFLDVAAGDVAVDRAEQSPPLHPHIPGPALRALLDRPNLDLVITIRHPVDMLWSYYNFFKPDRRSRYNFQRGWNDGRQMNFEEWIERGKLGFPESWRPTAPARISPDNLSPLGLDAHAMDETGALSSRVFRLEEPETLETWLSERLNADVRLPQTNQSQSAQRPDLGAGPIRHIRRILPVDAAIYGI